LSGGEIAGIAVGSSVGGVLILATAAVVVGVIAWKVTKGGDKYDGNASSGPSKRSSEQNPSNKRRSIWDILTRQNAVDVYNLDPKNIHTSITARAHPTNV
jgi:hypothetical protein